jgi:hypothetical protein
MKLLSRIRPFYMLLAFFLGLFYVHYHTPAPTVVLKFPSPYNAGMVMYRDRSDSCYKYRAQEVSCSQQDTTPVKPQPVVEDYRTRG